MTLLTISATVKLAALPEISKSGIYPVTSAPIMGSFPNSRISEVNCFGVSPVPRYGELERMEGHERTSISTLR
jgi:hypothetical protein